MLVPPWSSWENRRSPSCLQSKGEGTMPVERLPRALPRDVPDYHEREAAHWRALAAIEPATPVRSTLLNVAERHERLAARSSAIATEGDTPSAKAGRLRRCAATARRLAHQTHARDVCRQLFAIAMDYEKMARTFELQAAND